MRGRREEKEPDLIYLDNAAATAVRPEAAAAMLPWLTEIFSGASAPYGPGRQAHRAVSWARETVARLIGAKPNEIYFTSGATEADNWALTGTFEAAARNGKQPHIIVSAIEHRAVLETAEALKARGALVTAVLPDRDGFTDPAAVEAAIRPETVLVSVMTANNETGVLQPVKEIGAVCERHSVIFHTDAAQAAGHIPVDVDDAGVSLMSASSNKFGGPKGCGFLYIRNGVRMQALLRGTAEERQLRAGTENVPGIVGMATAAYLAADEMRTAAAREASLRNLLLRSLRNGIPGTHVNGSMEKRLPGNLNVRFDGIEAETALIMLDRMGICASAGAAWSTGSPEPSHVLTAMGLERAEARASLRFTVSKDNTEEEILRTAERMKGIVERLRMI